MVSGNGLQGFIESGSPYSDTFILQNMHFIMPNENQRTCPVTFDELETVKQSIVKGKDITDNSSYDDVYRYHPGGQLRINIAKSHAENYIRYTDYNTSQVGVTYNDKNGTWLRTSFTSMADGVVVTKLDKASNGANLNLTLSYDDLSTLANFGDSDEKNMKYTKLADNSGDYLALVSHYPNYKKSELKNGGYATVTYIITSGGTKERVALDKNIFGSSNADEYIRHSYRGGWCYLVKGKENKVRHNGTTGDVNSLYPSMMHSQSGNYFPIGKPYFWSGNIIPDEAIGENKYYFIRIKTRFYIKENKLPFIQIKGNHLYKGTESLTTSDILNKDGTYNRYYKDKNSNIHDSAVIMTVTMTDYKLMLKHYELVDFEILDGCWFYSMKGIFDNYINHYAEIKMNSKGAKRTEAKLFLNNLYGKLASSSNSSFKVAYVKDDESIGFYIVPANNKKVGHIATGSAITSYARNFTITAAQKNYYGVDKAGFIYADTDSIHCDLPADKIKGITVDPVKFCCWKLESSWDTAIFTRQKTYIEHITHNDLIPVDEPYNDIKCAGMPQKCKDLFNKSMQGYEVKESDNYTQSELKFLATKRDYSDFKVGLCVPGKLLPKRIKGGVLLVDTTYEMR
jgi:hypothetical protein